MGSKNNGLVSGCVCFLVWWRLRQDAHGESLGWLYLQRRVRKTQAHPITLQGRLGTEPPSGCCTSYVEIRKKTHTKTSRCGRSAQATIDIFKQLRARGAGWCRERLCGDEKRNNITQQANGGGNGRYLDFAAGFQGEAQEAPEVAQRGNHAAYGQTRSVHSKSSQSPDQMKKQQAKATPRARLTTIFWNPQENVSYPA